MAPPIPLYLFNLYHPSSTSTSSSNFNTNMNNNIIDSINSIADSDNNNNNNNNNSSSKNNTNTRYLKDYNNELQEDFRYWKFLCRSSRSFESVSDALKEAKSYSFIHIRPGTYEDNFTVDKPIHIIGVGGIFFYLSPCLQCNLYFPPPFSADDNSKVVIENKPSIGKVMVVRIVPDEDLPTPPSSPIVEAGEHSTPPATSSSPSSSPIPVPPPTTQSSALPALLLPLPSLRNCTLRQKPTSPHVCSSQSLCLLFLSFFFCIIILFFLKILVGLFKLTFPLFLFFCSLKIFV